MSLDNIIAIIALVSTPIGILLISWRDMAVMKNDIARLKKDVDGVALHVGTERAKARNCKNSP